MNTSLRVVTVHADAAGNDNENPGDEYVPVRNAGNATLDLDGWTVGDEGAHVYRFPDGFALGPGATATLYTGEGTDADDSLYWGRTGQSGTTTATR